MLWKRVCQLLGIQQRLSTAYHPETDGSTERMNQTVETYLRTYVDFNQKNWATLLPMAELAINNKDVASTGTSPFFLAHGYHARILDIKESLEEAYQQQSPVQQANAIVSKLKKATEWAQASMAVAQQNQQRQTDRYRTQAPSFKVGDKVWLNLKNIKTNRPTKKLDAKQAKYSVLEVIGLHSYRLDTPLGIHNVFNSDLLRAAATDPLPSQTSDDSHPRPVIVREQEEWEVEKILSERRRGRGKQYLVKWIGYDRPTWESASAMADVAALDVYEAQQEGEEGNMMG